MEFMDLCCLIHETGFTITKHKVCTYQFAFEVLFLIHHSMYAAQWLKSILPAVGNQCTLIIGLE